jgi:hypothetical protein
MKPQDLDRIRFITRHFDELKGLSFLSSGMTFLGVGVLHFEHGPFLFLRATVVFAVSILLIVGGVFLSFYSRSHYRRTFGEVQPLAGAAYRPPDALSIYRPAGTAPPASVQIKGPDPRFGGLLLLMWSLGIALYVALRMAGSSAHIRFFDALGREDQFLPMLMIAQQVIDLISGLLFLSTWLWRGRRLSQSYYLVLGIVMLGIAAFGAAQGLLDPILWNAGLTRMAKPLMIAAVDMERTGFLLLGICFVLAGLLDHWQLVRALRRPAAEPYAA